MLNDSVQEELASKISSCNKIGQLEQIKIKLYKGLMKQLTQPTEPIINSIQTSKTLNKPTNLTLVGFQNKKAKLPDWRLHLQNSVRKRIDKQKSESSAPKVIQSVPSPRLKPVTNGATALITEFIEDAQLNASANPVIANALHRIEESRKKYLASEPPTSFKTDTTVKQFPQGWAKPKPEQAQLASTPPKPNVVQFSTEQKKQIKIDNYETSKLPPLPTMILSSVEKNLIKSEMMNVDFEEVDNENNHFLLPIEINNCEEIEDFAPISLRFTAAIFDLLIGSFLSLFLLAPFMLLNGRLFSLEVFFTFLATYSIVMFIYLTTTIGFLGKTLGMRIFALEIVDIEENEYPTIYQAAISSAVYLFSLTFGGLGFLTMLLNNEGRAIHDLASRTIVVKEY